MSRKYFDRLLTGTGATSKKVESKFGEAMMKKMGWKAGDGLGRKMDGIIDCIQIKRRDENLGMGAEVETVGSKFKWNDQFWDDTYNKLASQFAASAPKGQPGLVKDNDEDTIDEMIDFTNSSNSDSCSSFDGELIIEKSKKKLMTIPPKKKKKTDKLDKSKAIKKDKKSKKLKKKDK